MAVSLPAIVLGNSGSGATKGLPVEGALNQGFGDESQDFNAIIGELSPALAEAISTQPEEWPELDGFIQQLQNLPQEGNPLPLLEQFLASSEASGKSPQEILQRLEEQLELLPTDPNVTTIATAISSLQTIIKAENTLPTTALVSTQALGRIDARTETVRSNVSLSSEKPIGLSSGNERSLVTSTVTNTVTNAVTSSPTLIEKAELTTDQKSPVLEPVAFQLNKANGNTMRTPEFSSLISAMQRVTSTAQLPSGAELQVRPEGLGLTSIAALSTTTSPLVPLSGASNMLHIPVSVQDPGWAQNVGERVQWMVGQQVQSAQIRLNPDHLGPMEIRLNIQNDQASIQINSAHAIVREALEVAIPRLREMLESSGIELVDVNVSDQQDANQQAETDPDAAFNTADAGIEDSDIAHVSESAISTATSTGSLDVFV